MSSTSRNLRFRQYLLRCVVEENLDTIQGHPFGTTRRRRERKSNRSRRAALAAMALLAAGGAIAALVTGGEIGLARPEPADSSAATSVSRIALPAPSVGAEEIAHRLGVSEPRPLVPAVIPVEVARIALDPGHGALDGGTSMGYGLLEKDLTMDIANRLAALLTAANWGVVLTREGDELVSLRQRAEIANAARADIFLSIHINWLPDRTARGFETYYLGPTDDPFLRRLAATENRDSGFALADYRELLQGIYADVRHDQSRKLAAHLQERLFEQLLRDNPAILSRGVMSAPFAVLVATEMPAVLVEVACLSNDSEARLLALTRYRERIAEALFAGITDFASSINGASDGVEKGSS